MRQYDNAMMSTAKAKGGAIVRMQDTNLLYFPRTCIFAIYTDAPAATKCVLTGSVCPMLHERIQTNYFYKYQLPRK